MAGLAGAGGAESSLFLSQRGDIPIQSKRQGSVSVFPTQKEVDRFPRLKAVNHRPLLISIVGKVTEEGGEKRNVDARWRDVQGGFFFLGPQ